MQFLEYRRNKYIDGFLMTDLFSVAEKFILQIKEG